MKHLQKYILFFSILLLASSCRKENPDLNKPEDYIEGNFSEVFDSYWNGMNNNYVFWDIDTTNWDRVYDTYKPLFAKLNLYDSSDVVKGYGYFQEMTAGLIDSHYDISFKDSWLADQPSINPAYQRKVKQPDYHIPISIFNFYRTIPKKYLDAGSAVRGFTNTADRQYVAVTGRINQDILYFFCSAFNLKSLYENNDPANGVKPVLQAFFDNLKNTKNIKGVIIDVRGNGGGSLADLNFLMGKLVDKQVDFGQTRSKLSNGRLDYSPWAPAFVTPSPDGRNITAPIIALADSWSVSMAELTTMVIKSLPNGHFIGERTWGGNGPLTANKMYNGGQFSTSFLNLVYTSSLIFKYRDGNIYEGIGFPPDQEVKYDKAALDLEQDKQLEAALKLIR
ncbi:S41 family peptidase [Chitinophaga nivalis]|uniref:S41 family peptidase n=1 Tax=Chitinophaga nivalis TaxID=2991709 RepID=A0ABT3IU00_9BACT|nr:S41 family peptidase [Chitinophaga nivalis]MCW3462859.1 S41 family peptidase [Chitinophaga nivalis]MCW3487451.1 S41 family peptidase [Chitinophaga nivalis]